MVLLTIYTYVINEGYPRNVSCTLNLISTFLWLSLGWYLCGWTFSPRGYHPPSGQCFGTDMIYWIYLLSKFVQLPNNVIITNNKGIGDHIQSWLSYLDPFVLLLPNTFKLFGCVIFRFWNSLMNVIPETRRAHYSTFVLLSQNRCICWWTISLCTRGYYTPSSRVQHWHGLLDIPVYILWKFTASKIYRWQ